MAPPLAMGIARAKDRREEVLFVFAVELHRADHGQITEAVVMRVEEGELSGAMGWIVSGIQIDRDAAGPLFQSAGMMFDDDIGQIFGHRKQIFGGDRVLEARKRWLRSEILSIHGIAIEQQFVYRIPGQGIGIVTVRVTSGKAKQHIFCKFILPA
jgi:hypothetical protein